jgi:uncharacterized protein
VARAEAFAIADNVVRPGSSKQIDLPVSRLPPGDWARIPMVVIHGREAGPCVWISGAIHGDELNGIEIVRRVLLRVEPKKLTGTLLAVPIVNHFGVTSGSRYLPDRRDLNRSFPGSSRGSLAGRLANLFFTTVVSRCSMGIDFHTGSAGRFNLPQIRCDLDDPQTEEMAAAFGAPIVLHATLRDGSLRSAARKAGARVLLYEGGEAERFDEVSIERAVDGTLRVLEHVGMREVESRGEWPRSARSRSSTWLRAGQSGFFHPRVEVGDRVELGQTLGVIRSSIGRGQSVLRARTEGLVIARQKTAVVYLGDALLHVARLSDGRQGPGAEREDAH